MEEIYINHWAVIVSAVSSLVLGGLWYSPMLFFNGWKSANSFSDEDLKKTNPAVNYTLSFFIALVISYNLAFFLGDAGTDWKWGMIAGFLAGFGFAALMFAIIAIFEMRSWKYIMINGGYMVVWFTLIGFILGVWR